MGLPYQQAVNLTVPSSGQKPSFSADDDAGWASISAIIGSRLMDPFRFQHFSVTQNHSGMRICTDATLFGAMAPIAPGNRVVDIGTGNGLLALMAAQLGAASVTGVEMTHAAYEEATANFRRSPWPERLHAVHGDVRVCSTEALGEFDLVISNPPFFEQHTRTSDALRRTARHADSLSPQELLRSAVSFMGRQGLCYFLLPTYSAEKFVALAIDFGLQLVYRTDIRGHADKRAKVSAMTFSRSPGPAGYRLLTIYDATRIYSPEAAHYLQPFLLRFARQGKTGSEHNTL